MLDIWQACVPDCPYMLAQVHPRHGDLQLRADEEHASIWFLKEARADLMVVDICECRQQNNYVSS